MSLSLMNFQMIRVISSPSSSTTGFCTLILAMRLRSFFQFLIPKIFPEYLSDVRFRKFGSKFNVFWNLIPSQVGFAMLLELVFRKRCVFFYDENFDHFPAVGIGNP